MRRALPALKTAVLLATALSAGRAARADNTDELVRDSAPMKWVKPFLPENLPDLKYPAYFNDLDKARAQEFHGRYKKALQSLQTFNPQKPEEVVAVALIRSKALEALGKSQQAVKALSDEQVAKDPAVQVRRAQVLAGMGSTDDALALIKDHLKDHPESVAGHYELGAICEQTGDIAGAKAAFTWFVDKPQNFLERWQNHERGPFESAEDVTLIGRALDRWGALTEQYRDNAQLHKTILNIFVRAYDVIDREYWPAHVAAGEYFMTHDQMKEAAEEFTTALKANPNDVRSLLAMGHLALEQFNFDGGDKAIAAIRQVNPDAIEGDTLEARNLLLQRRPELAITPVEKVLAAQPKNLEGMGLLAAVYALQLKDAKTAEVLQQVDQIDPNNASAYLEVAQQLSAMRQYPRSADMYKKAIERAPWWTAARNGLGLLYTQSGDEDDARTTLTEARQLDPFNLATTNYVKLLDMMSGFARKESAHFIVMYDPQADPVIPEYFSEYLESVHDQICKTFQYEPKVKTYIEVFPSHDAFSVRTTGSPWIGTVGASTGRVIALQSPRSGEGLGTFNWAQVLRHEYTHTVTLGKTDNRIQHWFTEGLAVYEERTPMRWEWVPMLYNAVNKHELFAIDQLTWSFVRPKRPIDRQLAYAESYWICKYLEETYGHDTILKMLDDFRNAEPQEVVFPKRTGKALPQFQSEFFAWCEQVVSKWGYDADSSKKYTELRTKADGLVKGKQYKDAVAVWEEIAKLRPVDALPHQRLAGLYLTKEVNEPEKAVAELDLLSEVELKDNRYAKRVARLYRDENKMDDAAKYALRAAYVDPYDLSAHELLAEIYEKAGNNEKGLEREKRVIDDINKMKAAKAAKDSDEEKNAGKGQ
ncbi:MAG TPA: tetratricopeptide repeat protein [Tepidisphaeraceae bacterium]|jgi:tetratricopeptide (TPR) repeat protein|nr:tetratricopeptide repeat protein [Tepidisphaeraceae bacterium]